MSDLPPGVSQRDIDGPDDPFEDMDSDQKWECLDAKQQDQILRDFEELEGVDCDRLDALMKIALAVYQDQRVDELISQGKVKPPT